MQTDIKFVRPLVAQILKYDRREWTVQGFGFLRTYFGPADAPKKFRLNLWHSKFTVSNVSTIHDHPWDLTSLIVAGEMTNIRYKFRPQDTTREPTHNYTTIRTGEGGGMTGEPTPCVLAGGFPERYTFGDTYSQRASEIHETMFLDGSVTLNERVGDSERARVFWLYGTEWVDAMPRPATRDEVDFATLFALHRWF